jgi:formamidopyrimidine-DNA glycosylase
MPELPEVETVLRGLKVRALGRRVTSVEVRHAGAIAGSPEHFAVSLEGRRITAMERKGKALGVELRGDDARPPSYLLIRLGMTGQFTVNACDAPLEPHTHARLALDHGKEEIRFCDPRRFGRLRSCTREELDAIFRRLGPDAQRITKGEFFAALRGRKGAIKSWLMNQQVLAGLGNIYADEALFMARIHPMAQPGRISAERARRLHRAIQRVLDHAVSLQGTTFRDYVDIEGRPGNYTPRLRVYQRTGEPCRRCKTKIRRLVLAGRSSHFCPRCQPRTRAVRGQPRPRHAAPLRGPQRVVQSRQA